MDKKEKIEKMGEMYENGASIKEIMNFSGYSENTVRYYMAKNGYKRDHIDQDDIIKIKEMYIDKDMTADQISKEINKPATTIRNILTANNIHKRSNIDNIKDKILEQYGELYRSGELIIKEISGKISKEYDIDISDYALRKLFNDNGYSKTKMNKSSISYNEKHKPRDEYNKERIEKRNKLYASIWKDYTELGMSKDDICEKYHLSQNTIRTYLTKIRKYRLDHSSIEENKNQSEFKNSYKLKFQKEKDIKEEKKEEHLDPVAKEDKPYLELANNKVLYNGRVYEILKGKKLRVELRKCLNIVS